MTRWRPTAVWIWACAFVCASSVSALAQETNEDQPSDPDTGESTVAERTLGLLPNPYERLGIKFAATYIGEVLGNAFSMSTLEKLAEEDSLLAPAGSMREGVVVRPVRERFLDDLGRVIVKLISQRYRLS